MKIIGLVTAILLPLCVTSHSQDVPATMNIVGTWEMAKVQTIDATFPINSLVITFTDTNTFRVVAEVEHEGERTSANRSGTFRLQGTNLTMNTVEANLTEECTVEMQDSLLLLTFPGKATVSLRKKKGPGKRVKRTSRSATRFFDAV